MTLNAGNTLEGLKIIAMVFMGTVAFAILHDQFTIWLSIEYFTVAHSAIEGVSSPVLLAVYWGFHGSQHYALFFGIMIGTLAHLGDAPKYPSHRLWRPVLCVFLGVACCSICAGFLANFAFDEGWLRMPLAFEDKVPRLRHRAFVICASVHNSSYAGGIIGGLLLSGWVLGYRYQMALAYVERRRQALILRVVEAQGLASDSG